jgi:surface carbohydrate biosynthesis protein
MRIALPALSPLRDLAGLVLLATQLCHEGATCFIVPDGRRWRELSALAPDFVLINQLRRVRQELAEEFTAAGVQVGVLDNEGGVMPDFSWYGGMLEPDPSVRHTIALFCTWGEKLAAHAAQENWYRPEQIAVTGMPRFDFYAPPWDDIPLPGAPRGDWPRPLVLINGSFPIANPTTHTQAEKVKTISKIRGGDKQYVADYQERQYRSLLGLAELTNHVTEHFPGITFVYRPHPFERLETYHELLTPRDNLHLIKEGSIHGWLKGADAIIQRGCTTAIEAGMLGVPALSPHWIETPEEIASIEAVSLQCESQNEMDAQLQKLLDGKLAMPENLKSAHAQVVRDWFCAADGRSHQRAANAIFSHHNPEVSPNLEKCRAIFEAWKTKDKAKNKDRSLAGRLRRALGKTPDENAEWENSKHYFSFDEVQRLVNEIEARRSDDGKRVQVAWARERDDYKLENPNGLSISLFCK